MFCSGAMPRSRPWPGRNYSASQGANPSVAKDDPDPKAISCYGLFVPEFEKMWLRVSSMGAR